MRKVMCLAVLVLGFISSTSAQWESGEGGNDFDGNYKYAAVRGAGSEFPYNEPWLFVRQFASENEPEIILGSTGYYPWSVTVLILVDGKGLLTTVDALRSTDSKSIFLGNFKDEEGKTVTKYELLNRMKSGSKLSVRIKDQNNQNDFTFTLPGSTDAMGFVVPSLDELTTKE